MVVPPFSRAMPGAWALVGVSFYAKTEVDAPVRRAPDNDATDKGVAKIDRGTAWPSVVVGSSGGEVLSSGKQVVAGCRSHAELHPAVGCPARDNTQGQGLRFDYFLGAFYHGLRQVCHRECTHPAINDIK